jgi:quercetin dioxygenase-like cupin family protein
MQKIVSVAFSILVIAVFGLAQGPKTSTHIVLTAAEVKWGAAPPSLPKDVQLAVVSGNPAEAGPFVIRLKFPAGHKVPPHWHSTDEHITVISGTIAFGMGEKFDQNAAKNLGPGAYAMMPAEMRHFAMAKTAGIVQVHGMGPFVLNYVNPADDPSKANAAMK